MRNLYEVLGVSKDATLKDIKKAFMPLALHAHPDKGGDIEQWGFINDAYQTLSDPEKRRNYDGDWDAYQEADVDSAAHFICKGYMQAGSILPYSHVFREQHNALVMQYNKIPIKHTIKKQVAAFESNCYSYQDFFNKTVYCHDIFTFLRIQNDFLIDDDFLVDTSSSSSFSGELTPIKAIKLFTEFLSGMYYGSVLNDMHQYFSEKIDRLHLLAIKPIELTLYEAIVEIISITNNAERQHNLIGSLKKITHVAENAPDWLLQLIIPLFYNSFFRHLYAFALHEHWQDSDNLFESERLKLFSGIEETKELLTSLKDKLSNKNGNDNLVKVIKYVKLLYLFEKDSTTMTAENADEYRKKAFHLLDWLPVFIDNSSKPVLLNLFLQIGILFQQASQVEDQYSIKKADEQLALKMYLTAVSLGNHATPDIEMYANNQAIKYLSAFQCEDDQLHEIVDALKKRTLIISDVFPFFEDQQSNIAWFKQEHKMLPVMRHLLNAIVNIHEHNRNSSEPVSMPHSAITILYQAYEACLKNWYQETYNPELEKKFRLELMDELLFENQWTFLDVEQHLDSDCIMVNRDEHGWIKSARTLPYDDDSKIPVYSSINGAKINQKTGEIDFFMTPWTEQLEVSDKLFTLFDVEQMLEKNLNAAIFSLDPVDPDKPFHPFNALRFSPSTLHESDLLNTMLLTDYMLKFLTTNQEVNGLYPFEQRPVAPMIKHLPLVLRKIITDFHEAPHSGALHRFWIEAENLDVSFTDEKDYLDIGLGDIKMVVKKHKMVRDIHGNLQDISNDDEGWPIYVLTADQFNELIAGQRSIETDAMIFIYKETRLIYWEKNTITKTHIPENYRETLIRLFLEEKDDNGKLAPCTKNMPLLYRATREMARQADMPHRYSPEFIFAHLFTTHYDEFAQYLPEFGRLRELSKMTVLIRHLDAIRQSQQDSLQAIEFLLKDDSLAIAPDTDRFRSHSKATEQLHQRIIALFNDWRGEFASSVLERKWTAELRRIKRQIEPLTFSCYSTEVDAICEDYYQQLARANPGVSRKRLFDEVIDPKRQELANQLSESKKKQCQSQMHASFADPLLASLGAIPYQRLITSFMNGNHQLLADALCQHQKNQSQRQVSKQFPTHSMSDIEAALDDNGEDAARRIATNEIRRYLIEQQELTRKQLAGFERIHLGQNQEPIDLSKQCLWVPASVRHEVSDERVSTSRYSFFVYGGVSIQPRVNVVGRADAPLGGRRVGGGGLPKARSLDNNATRIWYHSELAKIPSRLDKSRPLREQGLQAFKLRNEIKMQARELMADQKLAATLKPPETLKNKATSAYKNNDVGDNFWQGMIGSSQRTNTAVDESLGMKNTFAPARTKK